MKDDRFAFAFALFLNAEDILGAQKEYDLKRESPLFRALDDPKVLDIFIERQHMIDEYLAHTCGFSAGFYGIN